MIGMCNVGTFSDGMFSDWDVFVIGMFNVRMFSDGMLNDGTFCMGTI